MQTREENAMPTHAPPSPPRSPSAIFSESLVLMAILLFPASPSQYPASSTGSATSSQMTSAPLPLPHSLSSFSPHQSVKCKCLENATATFRKDSSLRWFLKVIAYYRNVCSERKKLPIQFPLDSNFEKCWLSNSTSLQPTKQMLRRKNNKCAYKFTWWVLLRPHSC